VVYAKRPFGGPEHVIKYLARYTHRVAISNGRLIQMRDRQLTFRWRDSADSNQQKLMTLDSVDFIRRFLLHVLPTGFVKIRHFGFLANRKRCEALLLCRSFLPTPLTAGMTFLTERQQRAIERKCPFCKTGTLHIIGWAPAGAHRHWRCRCRGYVMISSLQRRFTITPSEDAQPKCVHTQPIRLKMPRVRPHHHLNLRSPAVPEPPATLQSSNPLGRPFIHCP
jgi:hypothetical protein